MITSEGKYLFTKLLMLSESGNCSEINSIGAMGKYQFMPQRIKYIAQVYNYAIPSTSEFLSNCELQDKFYNAHLSLMQRELSENNLLQFTGTIITGKNKYPKTVKINLYGLLAGLHLGGVEGLKKLLFLNKDSRDANYTYISDYVAKFSDLIKESDVVINSIVPLIAFSAIIYLILQ